MPVDLQAHSASFQPSQALHWTFLPKSVLASPEDQTIAFNGHTVQAQGFDYITFLNYKGKNYELLQFHFHTPSENRVDGKAYASEMHMVHKASDGSLLVILTSLAFFSSFLFHYFLQVFGLFLEIESDEENYPSSPLKPVFQAIPVLAHEVEMATKLHKHGIYKAAATIPLLGFKIRDFLQYLETNNFSSRLVFT